MIQNENDQLLNLIHEETLELNNLDNKKDKKDFIEWLPKIYWLFYRNPLNFLIFIPSFLSGIVSIFSHYCMGMIIDSFKFKDPIPYIKKYSFFTFLSSILSSICNFLNNLFWTKIGSSIGMKIKSIIFKSLMKKDISFFDKHSIGELLVLLSEESSNIQSIFTSTKSRQLRSIGQIISSLLISFNIEYRITIFSLFLIFIIGYITNTFRQIAQKINKKRFKTQSESITIAEEVFSNIKIIIVFNRQIKELKRYLNRIIQTQEFSRFSHMCFFISSNITTFFSWGLIAIIINFGGYLILKNQLSPGMLFTLTKAAFLFEHEIIFLLRSYNQEMKSIDSYNKIYEIIEEEDFILNKKSFIPNNFEGKIEFQNVWFKYPTRDVWVLKDISFIINPFETIAIVGHSGSGKSTISQLLLRFYDVTSGKILIDGINIQEYDLRWLHQEIGLIQQDPILFSMSIHDNIIYGYPNATENEIIKAADLSHSLKFINDLPNNFQYNVGEKGSALSGGQKQRIAIARAIIRNPKIFISDESTSSLDSESEKIVFEALNDIFLNRTSIIIAHRLGTIKNSQRIIVFENGKIIEEGTHDYLLSIKKGFYNLIQNQLSN